MWCQLTGNNPNQLRINQNNRICPYQAKKLINDQGMFQAIAAVCSFIVMYLSYKRTSYSESAHQVTWESATFVQKKKQQEIGTRLKLNI